MFRVIRRSCLLAAVLPLTMAVSGVRADVSLPFEKAVPQNGTQQQTAPQQTTNNVAADARLTDDQVGALLKSMGYEPETYNNDLGGHYFVVKLERSGWKVAMSVSVSQDRTFIWISTPVIEIPDVSKVSVPALLKIMEQNYVLGPSFFSFRPAAGSRLYFSTPIPNRVVTPAVLRSNIDQLVTTVQSTFSLWEEKVLLGGAAAANTTAVAR
jgi:hypothetical protein